MTIDATYALQLMNQPRPPVVTNVMDGASIKPHWTGLRLVRRACSLTALLYALDACFEDRCVCRAPPYKI